MTDDQKEIQKELDLAMAELDAEACEADQHELSINEKYNRLVEENEDLSQKLETLMEAVKQVPEIYREFALIADEYDKKNASSMLKLSASYIEGLLLTYCREEK